MLGGLTYASMHIVEGWSAFDSPRNTVLSLIFVLLGYFGPGMFKSVLTLRTGNAWVHAIGYHSIAPARDCRHTTGCKNLRHPLIGNRRTRTLLESLRTARSRVLAAI
jgi:hypothetical protein